MFPIRQANVEDLPFIIRIDLEDEGTTASMAGNKSAEELDEHRKSMASFLASAEKGAFLCDAPFSHHPIGLMMFRIRNRDLVPEYSILRQIDRSLFPDQGQLVEVFRLWVDRNYRKRGIATLLKRRLEQEAKRRGVPVIYSYTEAANIAVIQMNQKLEYNEVWRGPIWDGVVRVAFVKHL
ncbi:GNAT family N-acetyltransferase [Paenibacillus soyae]|uniref:GNAT family N-acetyltransferase n=1 Tax=Paenibacillus soyae TaxID=2969249 RepID=A0A9X2MVT9_9BACL|nr:GNAT family N-acetyltransferase [Paenibacillus soyae]MCR2806823.1 GNAT family N-acetyltransferase [Paenibacillus soyae]